MFWKRLFPVEPKRWEHLVAAIDVEAIVTIATVMIAFTVFILSPFVGCIQTYNASDMPRIMTHTENTVTTNQQLRDFVYLNETGAQLCASLRALVTTL